MALRVRFEAAFGARGTMIGPAAALARPGFVGPRQPFRTRRLRP